MVANVHHVIPLIPNSTNADNAPQFISTPVADLNASGDVLSITVVPLGGSANLWLNSVGNWERARSLLSSADGQSAATLGLAGAVVRLQGFNDTTFDRIRALANNADAVAVATKGQIASIGYSYGFNGTTWDRSRSQANSGDAVATLAVGVNAAAAYQYQFNGATFDRVRTANIFKTVEVTASGNTTIWTPTSGKKFRLMGGTISACGTAAALTAVLLKLQDAAGGTNIEQFRIAINTTVTGDTQISFLVGGNGFLSAAANNVLNANSSTALTAGSIVVNVYGTEE